MKELSKSYNPQEIEDKIYKKWEDKNYFNPDECVSDGITDQNAKSFTIVMPPPNVTGVLHMGSAMMLAVEDLMVRYHRMKGDRTLWIPGTDHAGIATQNRVEKNLKKEGLSRHSLGREKFLERVEEFVEKQKNIIKSQMRKMGSSCDWSREAYTMDETRVKAVKTVFKMMYDDGLIYRGKRIVNWCPRCHSTLADDEVEYKEERGKLYWLKYGPFILATSRPETKLGDTAVAVHPDDPRYKDMVGKKYKIPGVLGEFEIIVVEDIAVDMAFGSGAIKVTPAHDFADYEISQRHNLPMKQIINEEGRMMENCGKYAGMTTNEAREAIVKDMEKMGLIDHIDDNYMHNIGVCYRCGEQIEPIPSLQWFIDVNKKIPKFGKTIKELCSEAVKRGVFGRDKIKIIPERFEKNYFYWMDNLRDWCISRQIWFGHQVPVWYRKKFKVQSSLQYGGQAKFKVGEQEIYVGIEPPEEEGWAQDIDTLDTWFSSGLWTFSTMAHKPEEIRIEDGKLIIDSEDFKLYHPTAVLETMYDILFFWVARMIIMTTYAVEDIPFQNVYMHGCVRDKFGDKMSKSKPETCIDPLDVCERYGTDAVRLSLIIGTTPGNDTKIYEEKIAGFRNFTNKLWNIARYISGKLKVKSLKFKVNEGDFSLADKWILGKLENVIKSVTDDIENYRFSQAGETLREFTWNDFADWYLEASKFEKAPQSPVGDCGGAGACKNEILVFILKNLLKLWHPFMPFVTEQIWQEMGNDKMLIVEEWPALNSDMGLTPLEGVRPQEFELIKNIITSIRNARAEYKIKPSQKIKAIIHAKDKTELIESQAELIKKLRTGIDEIEIKEKGEKIKNAIYLAANGVEIYLIVSDFDFAAEILRLEKEIKEQEKRIGGQKKKLENKDFVERAPKEIVQGEKDKLELWEDELAKMREQSEHLK
ncbi:MAG: valine--tRNA ligase [bacterium]